MTISPLRAILLGPVLVLAACGGDLTLPPEGSAAHIEVLPEGNNQSGRVGETLPVPLVARVTDSQDRPVAGTTVVFTIPDGAVAGEVTPSAVTDADGRASATLKLGTRTGAVVGRAEVSVDAGVTPVQASFNAVSLAANANGIAMVSGNDQSGAVGTQLTAPLVVVVTDAFGNPIPNITIEWSVTGGGGVSAFTTLTGDNGQASVTRTLGPAAGPQTTVATGPVGLAGSPVTFNSIATAGSAARVIVIDGNGQSGPPGTKLDKDLVVQVLDAQDNPISGRAVSWVVGVGGGSASPETSTTDANGRATTEWTLGPAPGPNTLTAVVSGVGNGAFNATGTKFESNTQITSHQPDPSVAGTAVTVSVNVSGSGGTPTGDVTVSGEGALASCTITLSNGSGSCQITLAQPGGNRDITATYAGDTGYSGSSDTEGHRVEPAPVANTPPTAAFTETCAGLQCDFTDQSTDEKGVTVWEWNFGDPASPDNTSGTPSPSHTFSASGTYTVSLTVRDAEGAANTAAHTVTVTAPVGNSPPTAVNDTYVTPGLGQPLTVPAPGVLANDSDPDAGDALSAQNASDPPQGSVSMNSDGAFTYTPDAGASGTDIFTYEASDGSATSLAIVEITITP